ncbi:helix-hairpin-helix domain-containing protein [Micromonospora sp. NPDC023737]|uniref:helix-hairpin-helix domain-containing protein n=1 Tax=unclassified Micromonospora TaxID=2617518 RepID=UPI0033DC8472
MAWFINQSLLIILAAFLLGLLVGWLLWGNRKPDPTSTGAATTAPTPAERARTGHDELERIEGIGPKMAAALRAAGIHTFGQLADTDDDTRRAAIEAAGLTFAPSLVTWGRQARLLADGDEAGFLELTERLVAGRDVDAAAQAQTAGRDR